MIELITSGGVGIVTGAIVGWFVRKFKEPPVAINYPPQIGAKGIYTVKLNGRIIYSDNDLDEAKRLYKQDYAPGHIVELYNAGHFVVSRESKNGPIISRT